MAEWDGGRKFSSPEGVQLARTPLGSTAFYFPPTELKRESPEVEPSRVLLVESAVGGSSNPATSPLAAHIVFLSAPLHPSLSVATSQIKSKDQNISGRQHTKKKTKCDIFFSISHKHSYSVLA